MDFTNNALDWGCDYVEYYYMGGDEMSKAVKHNKGKIKMSCLFVDLARELEQVAEILEMGMNKYKRKNWQQGKPDNDFFIDAILRHETSLRMGDVIDSESNKHHICHIITGYLFELWYYNQELVAKNTDDVN